MVGQGSLLTHAYDPRGTGLPANAWCYDHGWLAVKPFGEIAPLRPDLSPHERRRREVLWDYGDRYWEQHERALASLPRKIQAAARARQARLLEAFLDSLVFFPELGDIAFYGW